MRAEVRETLAELREEEIHRVGVDAVPAARRPRLDGERLVEGTDGLIFPIPEKRTELAPDMVLVDPTAGGDGRHRLLVLEVPHGTPFDKPFRSDGNWAATPAERAERLCRDARVELALLTDGELLRVIWAGPDGQMGQATWPTEFLGDERDLLAAFVELLGAQRFFAVAAENRLDALYRESVTAQQEVTKTLGRQVRQAVELLVNAISRADRAEGNRLLAGVEPREVYEAAVTVLMRIVFLLYAEERRLLPLDDPVYNANYAILPMRERLEERARLSDEALSLRPRRVGAGAGDVPRRVRRDPARAAAAPAVRRLALRPRPLPVPRGPRGDERLARGGVAPRSRSTTARCSPSSARSSS